MAFSFRNYHYFELLNNFFESEKGNQNLNDWEKALVSNLGLISKLDLEIINKFHLEIKKHNSLNLKFVFNNKYSELGHHEELNNKLEYLNVLVYSYFKELKFRINFDNPNTNKFINFIEDNQNNFSDEVQYIFKFVEKLPFQIMGDLYRNPNFQKIIEVSELSNVAQYFKYIESNEKNVKAIDSWNDTFEEKIKIVNELELKLEAKKSTYDFVLLNKGFKELYDQKKLELKERRNSYSSFGATLAITPLLVIIFSLIGFWLKGEEIIKYLLYVMFPISTFMLIILYFVRVSLQHVRSIQSQMMQLELRMALCQFIHNYAEDSEKLHAKNKAGFEKFENIIFSPLVSSDDKIPTTFDGMEQLAKLVSEFRK